jgi:2-C-methyl-D-erythritol 4-phosphate cytidylyltransferase
MNKNMKASAIILAGGMGTRMQSFTPKQFLELDQKPVAIYSFELFLAMPEIDEIVVVCSPNFQKLFTSTQSKSIKFALPGERRQDSVYNGLQSSSHELICIHDAARPIINRELVLRVLESGRQNGAAVVGMPIRFTIKEGDIRNFVKNTPNRANIWEIQTPQVLHKTILVEGFKYVLENNLTVTDDVSLAELIGMKVKLVEGAYTNLKLTVPSDLKIASLLLKFQNNE